ncbi:MAG: CHAP domain-containing protein, partial [Bacilli bacterium]|nr:CHAP domain-containing protein [Bacilli bacterium]
MNFIPRLTAPSVNNKYWLHTSKGGLNDCILIGAKSVLPNCVGYAFGRAYEILESYPKLSKNNAGGWFNFNDGYERGQTPKLGAIGVWRKIGTTKNWGHVAIVEEIQDNNVIVTSNSAYKGSRFYLKTIKPPYNLGNYEFLGFIYLPIEIENNNEENQKLSIETIAKQVISGIW